MDKTGEVIRSEIVFMHEQLIHVSNQLLQVAENWHALGEHKGAAKYTTMALNVERDREYLITLLTPDELTAIRKSIKRYEKERMKNKE